MDTQALLARIEADLGNVRAWTKVDDPGLKKGGAVGYEGKGSSWQFLAIGGWGGAAGTVTRLERRGVGVPVMNTDPVVVNLPPELAMKAWEAAKKSQEGGEKP